MKKQIDVCAELEKAQDKKKVATFLKKRKARWQTLYDLKFAMTGAELDVLKAALKMYAKNTTVKTKKAVAEDLLGLIAVQEKRQNADT